MFTVVRGEIIKGRQKYCIIERRGNDGAFIVAECSTKYYANEKCKYLNDQLDLMKALKIEGESSNQMRIEEIEEREDCEARLAFDTFENQPF